MRVLRGPGPGVRRVRFVLAFCLVAALIAPLSGRASAAETFRFFGGGFGHGAGFSQWGGFGLASKGRSYREILKHYYRDVTIGETGTAPQVRVGLVEDQAVLHLTAVGAPVRLRVGSPSSENVATIPAGETWSVDSVASQFVIKDDADAPVGTPVGGPAQHLYAVYMGTGARVLLDEADRTLNRGYLEMNTYDADQLRAVAVLALQSYLYGLGEVPSSWPMAVLKAQATAARTYALEKIARLGQNRAGCNCGVYASVYDQFYSGYDKEAGPMGERWVQAVDDTSGDVIRYEGELIQAFYHSSSGGLTESSENVFVEELPYIRGICDPGDYTGDNPNAVWEVGPLSAEELTNALASATGDIGTVSSFEDEVREPSDRLAEVTVVGSTDEAVITGNELRLELGLKSTRVFINRNLNVEGAIRKTYDRYGCRPGSATTASRPMPAGRYQRFENGTIYRNSDGPATVWLRGDTFDKYRALNEWEGRLGPPVSPTKTVKPRRCKQWACSTSGFDRGRIFYKSKSSVGAHALRGPVLQHYLQLGGVRSPLGFPIADAMRTRAPVIGRFENGTIHCNEMGICRT